MIINDLLEDATKAAMANCIANDVDLNMVKIETRDATSLMYEHRDPSMNFDVIDLDPYGTACPFIDSAVQAVSDGGLLIVTCTDSPVLSGNYPEVCFAKYGCMPVKAKFHSEMSLRILLNALETAANRYKRYIVPWLSLSVDFYVRVFVRVFESPVEVKNSSFKRSMLFKSTMCPSFYLQPLGKATGLRKDNPTTARRKEEKKQQQKNNRQMKKEQQEQEKGVGESGSKLETITDSTFTSSSSSSSSSAAESSVPQPVSPTPAPLSSPPRQSSPFKTTLSSQETIERVAKLTGSTTFNYGPDTMKVPDHCEETGSRLKMGGPFWTDPLHNLEVVNELLRRVESIDKGALKASDAPQAASSSSKSKSKSSVDSISDSIRDKPLVSASPVYYLPHPPATADRIVGMLTAVSEELPDVPFYYHLPELASTVQSVCPSHAEFKSALLNAGYRASHFHHDPEAIKTDAPPTVVWDIMRAYCKQINPPKGSTHKQQSESAQKILSRESTLQNVDFTFHPSLHLIKKVARYPENPEANWGPKRRAGKLITEEKRQAQSEGGEGEGEPVEKKSRES